VTPEEYAASQYMITAGLAAYVRRVATFFVAPSMGNRAWLDFLRMLFPEVEKRYGQSAELGRRFYDSQRKRHHPGLERNERLLSELRFDWFVQNMEPARKGMSQADSPNVAVTKMALVAVREVEMAGRRQVIGAVKNDPEPVLQGWARVATGRETCAFCLMLISRGAELNHKGNFAYAEAATSGINLDDETAIDFFTEAGGDPTKFLKSLREDSKDNVDEWHVGCDCVAVPVFDLNDWPGRDQARRALQLWIDAGEEAEERIKSGKARTSKVSTETLNALRRRLERGDISMSNYAAAA
jgi:hypothetical protein